MKVEEEEVNDEDDNCVIKEVRLEFIKFLFCYYVLYLVLVRVG